MKALIITFSLLLSTLSFAQHHHHHSEHAFMLMGTKTLFAYHLAKFNSPHQYQVILEISLKDEAGNRIDLEALKKTTQSEVFGLLSTDQFQIMDLVQRSSLTHFKADLYQGYLRDRINRKLLVKNLTLTIENLHYFQQIHTDDLSTKNKRMIVVCDPKTDEFYGAHQVNGTSLSQPAYEEVVRFSGFYLGAPGEDSPSAETACTPNFQGAVVTVDATDPDQPFTYPFRHYGKSASFEGQFFIFHTLFMDQQSINPARSQK